METECKRGGYDRTGRYHVPGPDHDQDQCPDCRCAPGGDHNPTCSVLSANSEQCQPPIKTTDTDQPVNIPWHLQRELFDLHASQALAALPGYLHLHGDEIMAMASARMESGYHQYGSTMFGYDPETRLRNILEELADCVCYLVSGPVP